MAKAKKAGPKKPAALKFPKTGKAKTKAAKPAKAAKSAKTAGRKADAAIVQAARARHRQPASQALPGMEQVRDAALDRLCESLGEEMAIINEANARIRANKPAALARMKHLGITKRVHGGVRLTLHEGAATLSVKLVKETTEEVVERTAGPSTVTDKALHDMIDEDAPKDPAAGQDAGQGEDLDEDLDEAVTH